MSEELTQDTQGTQDAPVEQPDVIINLGLLNQLISVAAEVVTYKDMVPVVNAIEKNIRLAEAPEVEGTPESKE